MSTSIDLRLDRIEKLVTGVVNGQSAMKSELLIKIDNVHKEVIKVHSELTEFKKETKGGFEKINDRADKIGKTLAYLDEDAPTGEEFDILKKDVEKVKQKLSFA